MVFYGSRGVPAVIVRLESTHVSFAEAFFFLLSVSPSEVILDVCVHQMKLLWGKISLNDWGRTYATTRVHLNKRILKTWILFWLASGHSRGTSAVLTPASWFVTSDLEPLTNQTAELETEDPDCNLMVFRMLKCVFNLWTLSSKYILILSSVILMGTRTYT